ncbi:MAG: ferrochelatase, partial [Planctomycetota bacterium]
VEEPLGVLVMAYGGPDSLEEVEAYLLDVRGHRPTPPEIVEEVRARYAAVGGRSPIRERTEAQARALEDALHRDGSRFLASVGMRHWKPTIAEALERLVASGVRRAVGLVLAPHYSRMSVELYFEKLGEARAPIEVAPIREWHRLPGFVEAIAQRVRSALGRFPAEGRDGVPVIFTAHSLPERIREWDDPYPAQLRGSVEAILERLGPRPHRFAYQSTGKRPEPWLGPDVAEVLDALAREGHRDVLVAPIGFTSEHLEVLYDVDLELRGRARSLGVRLERIEMANEHPAMIEGLAGLVRSTAEARGWR